MKRIMLALFAVYFLWSCDKAISSDDYGTPITVNLGIGGDVSVSVDPMTKGGADSGIYGINVFFDKERDGVTDDIYAYGLFDNVSDMTIILLSGYKYKFNCTFAKNEEHTLYYGQLGLETYQGYARPFCTIQHASTQLGNSFVYSNNTGDYMYLLTLGEATICSPETGKPMNQQYPKIHRYYGELDSYSPVAGGVATIPLKKTVFGLQLIIKGVPEGSLNAVVAANGTTLLDKTATSSDYVSGEELHSYPNVYLCWRDESTIPGTVNWAFTSSKFDQWNLSGSCAITFKRNVLTTITVSVTPDSASASISLTEEELGDENLINMGINTDGLIDIIVNPEPED